MPPSSAAALYLCSITKRPKDEALLILEDALQQRPQNLISVEQKAGRWRLTAGQRVVRQPDSTDKAAAANNAKKKKKRESEMISTQRGKSD